LKRLAINKFLEPRRGRKKKAGTGGHSARMYERRLGRESGEGDKKKRGSLTWLKKLGQRTYKKKEKGEIL